VLRLTRTFSFFLLKVATDAVRAIASLLDGHDEDVSLVLDASPDVARALVEVEDSIHINRYLVIYIYIYIYIYICIYMCVCVCVCVDTCIHITHRPKYDEDVSLVLDAAPDVARALFEVYYVLIDIAYSLYIYMCIYMHT